MTFRHIVVIALLGLPSVWAETPPSTPVTPTQCGPGDSGSPCGGDGPASQGNTSKTNQGAGNPINVITGNKYQQEVDLPALPGVLGLEIVRHYNSALSGPATPPGILGRGWRLSYETDLYAIGNTLQIVQADGTRVIFIRDLKNPSLCASSDPSDGRLAVRRHANGEEYLWTWPSGRQLTFNDQGKLIEIKAPSGEFVTLTRDPAGGLVKVTDPQGRSLIFGYPERRSDRFNGVVSLESPVGRFTYHYGSTPAKGYSGNRRTLLSNLVRVGLPDQTYRHYHYEDPAQATLLTGISVSAPKFIQRLATWAYDQQGRGILSVKGRPKRIGKDGSVIPGTGIEQITLEFKTGETVLTNSLGYKTVYRHAIVANRHRLLEAKGVGCASCGETNVKYGYDKLGRLAEYTKLDAQGQPIESVQRTLDAEGRPLKVSRIAYVNGRPGKPELLVRYEYAKNPADQPSLNPILIARPSVIPGKEAITRMTYNPVGQPLAVTESGYAPALAPIANATNHDALALRTAASRASQTAAYDTREPTVLTRTIRYRYAEINGRSLLAEIDGPLPNGPTNSPKDSDVTRISWTGNGAHVTAVTYPGGFITYVKTFDTAGRARVIRGVDGQLERFDFAYTGQPSRIQRLGRQAAFGYDLQRRPVSASSNDGRVITVEYLAAGNAVRYHLPDGQKHEERYDSERRLLAQGWRDINGRSIGGGFHYAYESDGRLSELTRPSGLRAVYRYTDNQTISTQQGTQRAEQHFDAAAHLLRADVAGARYQLRADSANASVALTLPNGAVHSERRDDFGRVVEQTGPERGARRAKYDLADRTIEVCDAVRVMSAKYDVSGRLIERRHRDLATGQERKVGYVWDATKLAWIEDTEQRTQYLYDAKGRLVVERIIFNGASRSGFFSIYYYDEFDRVAEVQLSESARLIQRYSRIGQPMRIEYLPPANSLRVKLLRWLKPDFGSSPLVTNIRTDSKHGLLAFTHANGEQVTSSFDAAGRLAYRQDGLATTRLSYSGDDQIQAVERNRQKLALAYDDWGRLAEVQSGVANERYALDANGNRLADNGEADATGTWIAKITVARADRVYNYRLASDQLLAGANQRYHYNSVGEPVKILTTHRQTHKRELSYGSMGELDRVSDNGKPIASYRYNQNRQRIAKTVNQQTHWYLWQGGTLAAEADSHGRIKKRYVYLGTRPVALIEYDENNSATVYAVHTDHLGTPLQLSDSNKRIVWQAEYDVFGRARVLNHSLHVGASPSSFTALGISEAHANAAQRFQFNLRLPGQYEDQETGYHYNFHRYYNPETGRYLTPDPIGIAGGTNLYAYADGDPVGKSDPWGLYTVYWGGAGLNGGYIDDQIQALKQAGLINVQKGTGSGGTILDIVNVNIFRYEINSDFFKLPSGIQKTQCPEQFNLIGYSYGSLIAAQTAYYYANRGTIVDNLVLIGAPIDADFLAKLHSNVNIKKVTIKNLTSRGDPIYAGMTQMELVSSLPTLASQQSANTGHFYYAPNNLVGKIRREALADELFASGLR